MTEEKLEMPGELLKKTSVIVCTVDRFQALDRCLASLRPFQAAGVEVVVVDNGPHHTAVQEIARRHEARVALESRSGAGNAGNTGIHASRGKFVAFIDDDAHADRNWMPRLLAPFAEPQVDAVVGSIWAEVVDDAVSQFFDRLYLAPLPKSRLVLSAARDEDPFPLRAAMSGTRSNMAIRREAFERVGGFDVRFARGRRIGGGGEAEFLLRLLRGGGEIVVEPEARIFHRHPTEWRAVRRWAFHSGCAHTAILTKYFLQEPSLRTAIFRYVASRVVRRKEPAPPLSSRVRIPRLPFLIGSLYGPLAFLLSSGDE
jgi:GT2 family glycosyltransferase